MSGSAGPDRVAAPEAGHGAGGPPAGPGSRGGWRFEYWLIPAIVILDQITKALVRAYVPLHDSIPVVGGFLNLVHVQNTGAAFGLLDGAEFPYKAAVVAVFATAALAGIAAYAYRVGHHEWVARLGLALILAGAFGNLIDRVTAGSVVDFVDVVLGGWHFWAFNVADSAITLGVVAMFADMLGLGTHVSTTS
jgi:signal peptidase II